ncbi:MAG: pyridoxamine 5'-phosphate oxidase family protein [Candidatus Bipolaricaulota bacterium]|nr:pyridoxamine 5'-phosphate oxidase family protein [Candidatus Bipolaricaulota bacterium]MCX7843933.1 pyridoxamine 5'-phosphate oxidase family protein [Candidatus Bipolaricaulota bacterium]MDW8151680.1 pyridoxamine 5'-phosphate oxidase family protein [Candidatus Bipolaricaulota bacterium]
MAEAEEKLWEIVEESEIALLITQAEGYPRVRPMTLLAYEEEGGVWFATSKSSRKVEEIGKNPQVTVCFLDLEGGAYAQLFGTAQIVEDKEAKEEFWDEEWEEYWEGPEDPDYVLLYVEVRKAEYYLLEADELWVVEFEG